jgi:hypothetical protein
MDKIDLDLGQLTNPPRTFISHSKSKRRRVARGWPHVDRIFGTKGADVAV